MAIEYKKSDLVTEDWSGTVSDDFECVLNTLNAVLSEYGADTVDADYLRNNYEKDPLVYYRKLGVSDSRENIDYKFRKHFKWEKPKPLAGAKEALRTIMDYGLEQAIVSTHHQKFLEKEVKEYGFSEYFPNGNIIGEVIDKAKELERLKIGRDKVYMVGDTWVDMEAAKEAGVIGIGVLSGYNSRELLEPHTDLIIEDVSELPSLLFNLKNQ